MTDNIVTINEVKEKLKRTIDYVRDCKIRADNGEIMDLTGLDKTVSQMCEDISKLPKDEADSVTEAMGKLVENLDSLAENIAKHKES